MGKRLQLCIATCMCLAFALAAAYQLRTVLSVADPETEDASPVRPTSSTWPGRRTVMLGKPPPGGWEAFWTSLVGRSTQDVPLRRVTPFTGRPARCKALTPAEYATLADFWVQFQTAVSRAELHLVRERVYGQETHSVRRDASLLYRGEFRPAWVGQAPAGGVLLAFPTTEVAPFVESDFLVMYILDDHIEWWGFCEIPQSTAFYGDARGHASGLLAVTVYRGTERTGTELRFRIPPAYAAFPRRIHVGP